MGAKEVTSDRVARNAEMRNRLENMKGQMQNQMGSVMNKMLGMMGKSVEDLMTGEQIQKLLVKTFNKFDEDGSGELEYPEFKDAFHALGLQGSESEIREAFNKVDV